MNKTASFADLKSGFLVFLLALPLCLGISMASGCPPIAGIITAMVGGLLSSFLGSTRLSIKGPAAGLIVIVLGGVQELGGGDPLLGYKRFLGVAVAAAVLQIVLSQLKAGTLAKLMPPSVIHGMLAAIGLIIIAKQIHVLFGVTPQSKKPLELLAEIPHSIASANPEILALGLITLLIVVFLPLLPLGAIKKVPPALVSLIFVLPLSMFWHVDSKFLVALPENFLSSFVFPDFSGLSTLVGLKYIVMLALVGSIESLLTVMAIDSLDPEKQKSNLNKDLFATGVGNLVSALIGGLPMISEVVRSKANIDAGAKTHWSNFFHAAFLLLSVSLLTPVIHQIPLAALAALLIITGFRLSSPKEFHKTYVIGFDQLCLFLTTLLVTLKTDLLLGVSAGLLLKLVLHKTRGLSLRHLFTVPFEVVENSSGTTLRVSGPAIFLNFLSLSKVVDQALQKKGKLTLDLSKAPIIDHTTLSHLSRLSAELGKDKFELIGLDSHRRVSDHELATHRLAS